MEQRLKHFLDKHFGYSGPILATAVLFFICSFSLGLMERRSMMVILILVVFSIWKGRFFHWSTWRKSLPYLTFFLVHVLFLINTSNLTDGWVDVQSKALLIVLPVCVFCWDRSSFILNSAIWGLGIGTTLRLLTGLCLGLPEALSTGTTDSITYINLSMGMHPTYTGMYVLLFQAYLVGQIKRGDLGTRLWPWFILTALFIALLSSKMALGGEIILFITAIYYLVRYQRKNKRHWVGLSIASVIFVVSLLFNPLIARRFERLLPVKQPVEQVLEAKEEATPTEKEATSAQPTGSHRSHIWSAALEVWKANKWVGVGTGDVNEALAEQYAKDGYAIGVERGYNAHNTFLQVLVAFGFVGSLVFLYLLFHVFSTFQKKRPTWKYAYFVILIGFLFIEAMFERQSGLLFFCLFLPLLSAKNLD